MKSIFTWAGKKHRWLLRGSVGCENSLGLQSQLGYHIRDKDLGQIHKAACAGDVARVQQLLALGKSRVNARDKKNRTPLHLACVSGHPEVVTLLIERNCMINATDDGNMTALMKAIQCHQEECATILLEHDADPNHMDENGNTALHYAAFIENLEIAKKLISHNADMEGRNKDGLTPLLVAMHEEKEKMVEFLIMNKANVHVVDNMNRTSLMFAAQYRSSKILSLLLQQGVDAFCEDSCGFTAEKYARLKFNTLCRKTVHDDMEDLYLLAKKYLSAGLSSENDISVSQNVPEEQDRVICMNTQEFHKANKCGSYKERKPIQDMPKKPLYGDFSTNSYQSMTPELERVSSSSHYSKERISKEDYRSENNQPQVFVRHHQHQVDDTEESHSISQVSLDVITSYCLNLNGEIQNMKKQLREIGRQFQEAEDGQKEVAEYAEKMEDRLQKLEQENFMLQDTVKKQAVKIEQLQKNLFNPSSKDTLHPASGKSENINTIQSAPGDQATIQELNSVHRLLKADTSGSEDEAIESPCDSEAKALFQERSELLEENNNTCSIRSHVKCRMKDLQSDLSKVKYSQEDLDIRELEKYKQLYLGEVQVRKALSNELNKTYEQLAIVKTKLFLEKQQSGSLLSTVTLRPVRASSSVGHFSKNLPLDRGLILEENAGTPDSGPQPSYRGMLEPSDLLLPGVDPDLTDSSSGIR
ncbi:POTE ankyrin domain family member B isoform X2 [Oryctolagus cuniculus]|uniref:POTE ankyrin domain family member B isoform X2 n=1 Tax=Oryctolagus cuniculus TaxID=9986 RepID=UPI00387994EB